MSEQKKKPKNKPLTIVVTIITVVIFAIAIGLIINVIVCKAQKRPVSFFGISYSIVVTDSMEPEIMTGDLIVFHSCNIEGVALHDYVVFVAGDGFDPAIRGQTIVHEVIEIVENGLITKGINNTSQDKMPVTSENLLGICTGNSAFWGAFFLFLSRFGIFIIIAVVAIPIIVTQTIKIVKLSKGKDAEENGEPTEDGDLQTDVVEDSQEVPEVEIVEPPESSQ